MQILISEFRKVLHKPRIGILDPGYADLRVFKVGRSSWPDYVSGRSRIYVDRGY